MSETLSPAARSYAPEYEQPEYSSLKEYQEAETRPEAFVKDAQEVLAATSVSEAVEILEDWKDNPAERIVNQLEQFAIDYKSRSDRETYYWYNSIEEVTSFATRDSNEDSIEEMYYIIDTYSPNNKKWKNRTYAVTMNNPDNGSRTTLTLDAEHKVQVSSTKEDGRTKTLHGEPEEDAMIDFFARSVIAWDKNRQRSSTEKAAADADAHMKLEAKLYGGPKPAATSLE